MTYVLDALGDFFTSTSLNNASGARSARRHAAGSELTIAHFRALAASTYTSDFGLDTELSERVLWPSCAAESHGMEDARFVRFVDDDRVFYYAYLHGVRRRRYPATSDRDGRLRSVQDVARCRSSGPVQGPGPLPCRINGRYYAFSSVRSRNQRRLGNRQCAVLGRVDGHPGTAAIMGDDSARQLWLADRDARRVACADPRSRRDALVHHWGPPARPR